MPPRGLKCISGAQSRRSSICILSFRLTLNAAGREHGHEMQSCTAHSCCSLTFGCPECFACGKYL